MAFKESGSSPTGVGDRGIGKVFARVLAVWGAAVGILGTTEQPVTGGPIKGQRLPRSQPRVRCGRRSAH
jgi:hypothetical protein